MATLRRHPPLLAASALAVVLAACGDDPAPGTDDSGVVQTDADDGAGDTGDPGADTGADPGHDAGDPADAAPDAFPDAGADTARPDTGDPSGTTFHGDVRALVDAHCVSCHRAGGIGPIPFDDPADWAEGTPWWGRSAAQAVADGRMPPWLPADDCRDILGARALGADELATFAAWADAGYPAGDPADYVAPPGTDNPLDALGDPALITAPAEAYAADPRLPDDYRCQVLEQTFDTTTYLRAVDVYPDRDELVHHVLIYRVAADDVDRLQQLDDRDEGPGYTCFGGPGVGEGGPIGAWVPGMTGLLMPDDAGIVIEAGTRLVMQVHYNTLGADDAPAPDRTQVAFWTYPVGTRPADELAIIGFAHGQIDIPAGEPRDVEERTFNIPLTARVVGFAPHMHTLGTSFRATLTQPDGEEACLIDIPAWDFNWQQFYSYTPDAFFTARDGARMTMQCVYDNSPANQPVVNGERLEPRDVRWGEGTLDEMCLGYVLATFPLVTDGGCGEVPACVDACDPDDATCVWQCHLSGGDRCALCHLEEAAECGRSLCGGELLAVLGCIDACDDDTVSCLATECRTSRDAAMACLQPHIVAGTCDSQYASCAE